MQWTFVQVLLPLVKWRRKVAEVDCTEPTSTLFALPRPLETSCERTECSKHPNPKTLSYRERHQVGCESMVSFTATTFTIRHEHYVLPLLPKKKTGGMQSITFTHTDYQTANTLGSRAESKYSEGNQPTLSPAQIFLPSYETFFHVSL